MKAETLTIIVDAVVSVAVVGVGIWVLPEYRDFALAIVAALQAVAGALIVELRGQRREAAALAREATLRAQIGSLMGR